MKFAVIGDPISHSLSPLMHNKNFESLDLKFTYEAVNV
ncbi:shikimate dehydrogenase, partial [Bacillaceae bacterium HSR45]|nr:shikimate dehydrogenase [Bacillaceae bacterium HSR45]